ncbi:MAG: hypothetical protein R2856_12310 [Caldilineaceae bacterium]
MCRFFLDQSGPALTAGDREMPAFLVDMARLYERFVAGWVKANVGPDLRVRSARTASTSARASASSFVYTYSQRRDRCAAGGAGHEIQRRARGRPADLAQVVAYATAKRPHRSDPCLPDSADAPVRRTDRAARKWALPFVLDGGWIQRGDVFWRRGYIYR